MAVRLDLPFAAIKDQVGAILADVRSCISFGVGQVNDTRADHELFDDAEAWRASGMEGYRQKAAPSSVRSGAVTTMST